MSSPRATLPLAPGRANAAGTSDRDKRHDGPRARNDLARHCTEQEDDAAKIERQGLDMGDRVEVTLKSTDVDRAFIDFERA